MTNNEQVPTQELQCGACGEKFRVHQPFIIESVSEAGYVVAVTPSWSVNERVCPKCGTRYTAVIMKPQVAWVSIAPSQEQLREEKPLIHTPRLILPGGFNPKGRG